MNWGVASYKDLFEIISYIITSLSLIAIIITYAFSKKQIHFATMEKCISDFRDFETASLSDDQKAKAYFELVNEELFYFENNYLPRIVAIEWIDGMIEYLPFKLAGSTIFFPSTNLAAVKDLNSISKYLEKHPRILKVVTIKNRRDWEQIFKNVDNVIVIQDKEKLIKTLVSNLGIGWIEKRLYSGKINRVVGQMA